jgi:TDG/mug DNA glycosylase family protein
MPSGRSYAICFRCRRTATIATRIAALKAHHIALWDVIAACARQGSLDANIRPDSIQVNDFGALFEAHPDIRCIAFNGGTAEREYRRRVLPGLDQAHRGIELLRLPSTSPAYAGMSSEAKLATWRVLLERVGSVLGDASNQATCASGL